MILFDLRALSVNSFNRKRCHIGIQIIIRIIYYPINGYLDSKLSVLSIPIIYTLQQIENETCDWNLGHKNTFEIPGYNTSQQTWEKPQRINFNCKVLLKVHRHRFPQVNTTQHSSIKSGLMAGVYYQLSVG